MDLSIYVEGNKKHKRKTDPYLPSSSPPHLLVVVAADTPSRQKDAKHPPTSSVHHISHFIGGKGKVPYPSTMFNDTRPNFYKASLLPFRH
jgi:hypothetical protein